MAKIRRHEVAAEAARRNREQLAALGGRIRTARRRRRLTQVRLGERVGLGRSTVSALERGHGGGHTLDTWQRLALALELPLVVDLGRDPLAEPADAGHLAVQELVLRLGRRAGFEGIFELPSRPASPARSVDVGLRADRRRLLVLVECWNTIGDIGAAARSTTRKLAEAEDLATARWGDAPHRVGGVWVVRATRANRALVTRYPEVFGSRFPGSSLGWLDTLTGGSEPPGDPGLVWCDVGAARLFAWRRPGR